MVLFEWAEPEWQRAMSSRSIEHCLKSTHCNGMRQKTKMRSLFEWNACIASRWTMSFAYAKDHTMYTDAKTSCCEFKCSFFVLDLQKTTKKQSLRLVHLSCAFSFFYFSFICVLFFRFCSAVTILLVCDSTLILLLY